MREINITERSIKSRIIIEPNMILMKVFSFFLRLIFAEITPARKLLVTIQKPI
jgi:hypothetical protein